MEIWLSVQKDHLLSPPNKYSNSIIFAFQNGAHCAFAHTANDIRPPMVSKSSPKTSYQSVLQFDQHEVGFSTVVDGEGRDKTSFVIEDPQWHCELFSCFPMGFCFWGWRFIAEIVGNGNLDKKLLPFLKWQQIQRMCFSCMFQDEITYQTSSEARELWPQALGPSFACHVVASVTWPSGPVANSHVSVLFSRTHNGGAVAQNRWMRGRRDVWRRHKGNDRSLKVNGWTCFCALLLLQMVVMTLKRHETEQSCFHRGFG